MLLCLLSYYVEAVITRDLRKAKATFTTGEFFRALNRVYAIPVDVRGSRAWVRNEMKGAAQDGYDHLHIKIPDRVLKIEKIGSDGNGVAQNLADISKPIEGLSLTHGKRRKSRIEIRISIFESRLWPLNLNAFLNGGHGLQARAELPVDIDGRHERDGDRHDQAHQQADDPGNIEGRHDQAK